MNPEALLHEAAVMLRSEAVKGPGTMFLLKDAVSFFVTRTPKPEHMILVLARFDCQEFEKGLSASQWSSLLKKLWTAHEAGQKGDAVEQQPAKKP